MRVTPFTTGDYQFDLDNKQFRYITNEGEAQEWKDASVDYVFSIDDLTKAVNLPRELLPYFQKQYISAFEQRLDRSPIHRGDLSFMMIRVVPAIFMDWFNDFFHDVKDIQTQGDGVDNK